MTTGYESDSFDPDSMLGRRVHPLDPDRPIIEPWARRVSGRILDVGSGTGRWAGRLAELGHEVVGLDPSPRLTAIARETFPGVDFREGTMDDISDQRFGGILAWYSLIHVPQAELSAVLRQFRSTLDDDGLLLLSFFAGPTYAEMGHPGGQAFLYPLADMQKALGDAGFEVDRIHYQPPAPHAKIFARVK